MDEDKLIEPVELLLNQLDEMWRGAIVLLPQIAVAVIVIILTAFVKMGVSYAVGRVLKGTKLRPSLRELISLIASIVVWILGLMIAAVIVFPNLTPASMLTGLGIGSVAIGFAFKDVFENFLAGIIILFRREMRIGDHIECEGVEGRVDHIAIRETHIMQTDGQLVIMPNSMLFKNPVTVRTHHPQRRVTFICGVAYDVDLEEARKVMTGAVEGCETVEKNKPIQIFAQEFGDSSINFEVTWWTASQPVDLRASRNEVVTAVKSALDAAGLEIPFPYRTLTFKEPLPIAAQGKDQIDDVG